MGASDDDVLKSRDGPSNWSGMLSLKGRGVALAGTWAGGVDELEEAEPCGVAWGVDVGGWEDAAVAAVAWL